MFGSVRLLVEHEPSRTSPQMFGSVRFGTASPLCRQRNSHQSSAPAKNVAFDLIHGAYKIRYGERSTTCGTSIQLHNLHAPNCGSHQHYLPRLHAISQHPVIETISSLKSVLLILPLGDGYDPIQESTI